MAEFKLTFKRKLHDDEALAPLKEGIQDGKMGSLTVDPESLEVKKDKKGNCSYSLDAIFFSNQETTNYAIGVETSHRKKKSGAPCLSYSSSKV